MDPFLCMTELGRSNQGGTQRPRGPRGPDRLSLWLCHAAVSVSCPCQLANTSLLEEAMLQEHRIGHVILRKYLWLSALAAVVALALLLSGNAVWAKERKREGKNDRAVRLLATVPIPPTLDNNTANGLYSFDISWVDQATETYYLADRSNRAVDIVDAKTNTFLGQLTATPPFRGVSPPAF